MLRQGLFAIMMLVMCIAFVTAETIKGKITKADEKTITITNKQNKDGKTFDLAKDFKLYRQLKKDQKEEVTGDAKREALTKLPDGGVNATVTYDEKDGNKVTEILLTKGKKAAQ